MQYLVQQKKKFNYDLSLFKNIDFKSTYSKKVSLLSNYFEIDSQHAFDSFKAEYMSDSPEAI